MAGILLLDKLKIDDPVGAFPVHGLCGVWGGIATGIFGEYELSTQIIGSLVIPLWSFVTMALLFLGLKATGILRVSPEDEAGRTGHHRTRHARLSAGAGRRFDHELRPGHRFRFLPAVAVELGQTSALPRVVRGSRCWIHLQGVVYFAQPEGCPNGLGRVNASPARAWGVAVVPAPSELRVASRFLDFRCHGFCATGT